MKDGFRTTLADSLTKIVGATLVRLLIGLVKVKWVERNRL
jgi:hypothetical protein